MVYKEVVVHVASEIPQGSCGFNLVVEHEQKHVNTNQQVIMDYIPVMQDKMHKYLKVFGRIHDPDYGHAMTVMHDKTKSYVGELLHDLSQEENNRQQQMNSDAEFQQLTRSCNGQLGQIAAQYSSNGWHVGAAVIAPHIGMLTSPGSCINPLVASASSWNDPPFYCD